MAHTAAHRTLNACSKGRHNLMRIIARVKAHGAPRRAQIRRILTQHIAAHACDCGRRRGFRENSRAAIQLCLQLLQNGVIRACPNHGHQGTDATEKIAGDR